MVLPIKRQSLIAHIFYLLFEELLCLSILAEILKLIEIEEATLVFIYNIKELLYVLQIDLDAVLLKHLLELLRVK